jgi:hypothetical protein
VTTLDYHIDTTAPPQSATTSSYAEEERTTSYAAANSGQEAMTTLSFNQIVTTTLLSKGNSTEDGEVTTESAVTGIELVCYWNITLERPEPNPNESFKVFLKIVFPLPFFYFLVDFLHDTSCSPNFYCNIWHFHYFFSLIICEYVDEESGTGMSVDCSQSKDIFSCRTGNCIDIRRRWVMYITEPA